MKSFISMLITLNCPTQFCSDAQFTAGCILVCPENTVSGFTDCPSYRCQCSKAFPPSPETVKLLFNPGCSGYLVLPLTFSSLSLQGCQTDQSSNWNEVSQSLILSLSPVPASLQRGHWEHWSVIRFCSSAVLLLAVQAATEEQLI